LGIISFLLIGALLIQSINLFFSGKEWNALIQYNSILIKLLFLVMVFGIENGYDFILDMILVLIVANIGGTIIISRFLSRD